MRLEVKDITKSFGEKQVLSGISFSVESGEALGLLGRNGAGKTTTIRIIMQLFEPNSGEILLDGKPINIREINVGYMPEERGLYPKKKIMEQLVYFANLRGLDSATAKSRVESLLDRLQMTEYKDAKLETLSKGNQQKIQLIATLVCNPDIVILDEPFSGLDPVNAMLLKDVVRELIADGKLVIFSSHQMNYIEEFCNNIVIINSGKVAVSGTIKDIKHSYTKNLVSLFTEDEKAEAYLCDSAIVNTFEKVDNGFKVELCDGKTIKDFLSELSNSDVDISGVSEYEPSLAEIFVDYTEVAK